MVNVGTILHDNLNVTEHQGKSSNPGNDTDVEGAKISKNGSDDDITIARSSHEKYKNEVQWSNNGLFENDHELEKTNENNKALKEANNLLTKELKIYKERLQILGNKPVNNTFIKKDYDELQTQLLVEKQKIEDLEKEKHELANQVSIHKGIISSVSQVRDTLKANFKHRKGKYLNDILQLQAKNKDLKNIVCKIGKSTETLRLLTNEQRAYQDNTRKSGLGYKGPCVLSQANANNPKLYSAYELCGENVQLHVFDSEKTLEDAEKSQLKMKEFQKDKKSSRVKDKIN
ncbi:hypothetical protein Tco_1051613 [Tanacetum coccineum]